MTPALPGPGRFGYRPIVSRAAGRWPGGQGLAVYVALNLEQYAWGEGLVEDLVPGIPKPDVLNNSWREYGNRVGAWRLMQLFDSLQLPVTLLINSELYGTCPELVAAFRERGAEIASHGRTNSEHQADLPEAEDNILLIRLADPRPADGDQILKKTVTLVPLGDGLLWVGGAYQWNYTELTPGDSEKQSILEQLKEVLAVPFDIAGQVAGIRPTVKDRRPFVGESRVQPAVFLFNGLGSKGALLAPFWAEHLAEHMLDGKPLDREVDIRRWES